MKIGNILVCCKTILRWRFVFPAMSKEVLDASTRLLLQSPYEIVSFFEEWRFWKKMPHACSQTFLGGSKEDGLEGFLLHLFFHRARKPRSRASTVMSLQKCLCSRLVLVEMVERSRKFVPNMQKFIFQCAMSKSVVVIVSTPQSRLKCMVESFCITRIRRFSVDGSFYLPARDCDHSSENASELWRTVGDGSLVRHCGRSVHSSILLYISNSSKHGN